jgi:hypothetical protein
MSDPKDRPKFRIASPGPGAYRVRFVGENPANVANTVFSSSSDIRHLKLEPGRYTAEIEPISSGARLIQKVTLDSPATTIQLHDTFVEQPWIPTTGARPSWSGSAEAKAIAEELDPNTIERTFSVGVATDTNPGSAGGWRAEAPRVSIVDAKGAGLGLLVRRPQNWKECSRWLLTIAVEDDALWRVPLPLFKGGLQLSFSPIQSPTGPDFALALSPRDPAKAALVSALERQFVDAATDVVKSSLQAAGGGVSVKRAVDTLADSLQDPWAAIAAAHLLVRAGNRRAVVEPVGRLQSRCPWLPDAAVVLAWAEAQSRSSRVSVEARCLELIELARRAGATFYTASDSLAVELLTALSVGALDSKTKKAASRERNLWIRRSKSRMPTGAFLSWEDRKELSSTGRLSTRHYVILSEGALKGGRIVHAKNMSSKEGEAGKGRKVPAPALKRNITNTDDPCKGRFGGVASRGGYTLSAKFGRGLKGWVQLTLRVKRRSTAAPASQVQFFLHDSFEPDRIVVPILENEAELPTLAYGGFTVGVWIAEAGIELELDLAEVKDAPEIIRTS